MCIEREDPNQPRSVSGLACNPVLEKPGPNDMSQETSYLWGGCFMTADLWIVDQLLEVRDRKKGGKRAN
jgi:hypothetical protein